MNELFEIKDYSDFSVSNPYYRNSRKCYFIEIKLIFYDGTKKSFYRGGFKNKKEALKQRDEIIGQLYTRTFITQENVKVSEFFINWLEYIMKPKLTYNSYMSYKNVVYNYICVDLKQISLIKLTTGRLTEFYQDVANKYKSMINICNTVIKSGLNFAVKKKILSANPNNGVNLPKIKRIPYRMIDIDSTRTLTLEQLQSLITSAKTTPIYLHILFAGLMGLRRSEIIGLKFSDVDYLHRTLSISRQLGVDPNKQKIDVKNKQYTKQEINVKTESSNRVLEIPDIVFEAILEARKEYEANRRRRINDKNNPFRDWNYICCSTYGNPRSKDFHRKYFKRLLEVNNLPNIRFHDLRKTFSTILYKNGFSGKAISKIMGHSSNIITMDVYGDNKNIISDPIPELEEFINEVIPKDTETNLGINDIKIEEKVILELLPV